MRHTKHTALTQHLTREIHRLIQGDNHRFIRDEASAAKHDRAGLLGMAKHAGANTAGSQFYMTLGGPLQHMDRERHVVFGEVVEGLDVLASLDELFLDNRGRPLQDVRITATHVLLDPTPDVPGTATLPAQGKCSASGRPHAEAVEERLEYAASKAALAASVLAAEGGGDQAAVDAARAAAAEEAAAAEARSRATVLEMVGDLPDADVAPPDTVLFVAKLNPVTTDEDLELIFSRHGEITSCDIIRDWKTGESLCFAFIEFADRPACEQAYLKMNNVLIGKPPRPPPREPQRRTHHVHSAQMTGASRWTSLSPCPVCGTSTPPLNGGTKRQPWPPLPAAQRPRSTGGTKRQPWPPLPAAQRPRSTGGTRRPCPVQQQLHPDRWPGRGTRLGEA